MCHPCVHCAIHSPSFVGQIELYTHIPVMKQVVDQIQKWNFRLCAVFLLDSQFLIETSKFFAGAMTALSAMVTLELPHINVLSKMDLLDKKARIEVEKYVINTRSLLVWALLYPRVTTICRYIFLRFWLEIHFASTKFTICTRKCYRVDIF